MLFTLLMLVLGIWRLSLGSVSFDHIVSRKVETFYWVTILFSNTLGTALGDFFADDSEQTEIGTGQYSGSPPETGNRTP